MRGLIKLQVMYLMKGNGLMKRNMKSMYKDSTIYFLLTIDMLLLGKQTIHQHLPSAWIMLIKLFLSFFSPTMDAIRNHDVGFHYV